MFAAIVVSNLIRKVSGLLLIIEITSPKLPALIVLILGDALALAASLEAEMEARSAAERHANAQRPEYKNWRGSCAGSAHVMKAHSSLTWVGVGTA